MCTFVNGQEGYTQGYSYTEDFYLCNGGDGSSPRTGECDTAFDETDFNTSGNWTSAVAIDGKIGPSDIVILLDDGGNFDTELDVQGSGSSGHSIEIVSGPGEIPVINGTANGIHLTADDYITIDGITITGFTGRGIYAIDSDSVIVKNCTISGGNGVSPDHGIQIQGTNNVLETGIQIIDNTIGTIGTAENDTVGFNGIIVQETNGAIIARNVVNTTNSNGIRHILGVATDSTNGEIYDNELYGCYGNILVSNSDDTKIYRNRIRDGTGAGIGLAYDSDNAEIYYNVINNLAKSTNLWNGIDVNHDSQDGVVYNNTIYKVYNNSLVIDDETAACDGWTFKNNILDASENTGTVMSLRVGGSLTLTSDYNTFYSDAAAIALGTQLVTNNSLETFTGTEDNGVTDAFTNWTVTAGSGVIEAVTVADGGLSSIPAGVIAGKLTKGVGGAQAIATSVTLTADETYTISWSSVSDGTGTGRGAIHKSDYSVYLQNDLSWAASANWNHTDLSTGTSATWGSVSVTITAPSTGTYVIRHENYTNSVSTYIDNVEVYIHGIAAVEYEDGTKYTFAGYQTVSSLDGNSVNGDSLFTDVAVGNFILLANSPSANTGVDLGDSYTNGLNPSTAWTRGVLTLDQDSYGAGWEIGAFVYIE